MPQGGSVTMASMLFIALVGYWFGIRAGLVAGIAFGFLRMQFGGYILVPAQAILDYIIAYAALGGLAGIFSGKRFGQYGLYIGYLVGVTGTFLSNFTAGVIFFGAGAPAGQHVFVFSAIYNLSHIVPEVIITFAILCLPSLKQAIIVSAPTGSVSSNNAFSRMMQTKNIGRLPYVIVSAALLISFFVFPIIHRAARIRINATGWELAMGSGGIFEEASYGGYPITLMLLIAPSILLVLALMKKSAKALTSVAIAGLLVKLGFIGLALIRLRTEEFSEIYALTLFNWIALAIFVGLIWGLRAEAVAEEVVVK